MVVTVISLIHRCDVDPSRVALWWDPKLLIKLSGAAAYHLASQGRLDMTVMIPHRKLQECETERCLQI
jgi:hypothetical protein